MSWPVVIDGPVEGTIHVITAFSEYRMSLFLTDDCDAYDEARRRGITIRSTCEVLRIMVVEGDISEARDGSMLQAMLAQGRNPKDPPTNAKWFSP